MDDETTPKPADHEPEAQPPAATPSDDMATLRGQLDEAEAARREAVTAYRDALLAGEPLIDEALVTGATVEEVRASFETAVAQVTRVREALRREQAAPVPAGAPGRSPDLSGSAFDKIRRGLEQLAHG